MPIEPSYSAFGFTDEELGARRGKSLPRVAQLTCRAAARDFFRCPTFQLTVLFGLWSVLQLNMS